MPRLLLVSMALFCAGAALAQGPSDARPLLLGDWPDPTICKDGEDYYLTHSSGPFRPAALIWHSRDLQTWTPLGYAVPRQDGNVWVSELTKFGDRFLLYYSANRQVYLVSAASPGGPWSEPVAVQGAHDLDVGHVVDDQGRRFLLSSGGTIAPLDETGTRIVGEKQKVHERWPIPAGWAVECECLESPRVERRGDWYYMLAAEGGTFGPATAHMVVAARARQPLGPWENAPHNPLIHTYSREEAWWAKGHGDLIEGPSGQWWCVLHGQRAYHRTLGRCTLLEPIAWTPDGWPRVAKTWPASWQDARAELPLSDEFDGSQLGLQWQFYGDSDARRFRLENGALVLDGRGAAPGESVPLCVNPRGETYTVETELELEGDAAAGLMLFAGPELYVGLELGAVGAVRRVAAGLKKYAWARDIPHESHRIAFRITNRHEDVTLAWRDGAGEWHTLTPAYAIDRLGDSLSGVRPALFVHGSGRARFHSFSFQP